MGAGSGCPRSQSCGQAQPLLRHSLRRVFTRIFSCELCVQAGFVLYCLPFLLNRSWLKQYFIPEMNTWHTMNGVSFQTGGQGVSNL